MRLNKLLVVGGLIALYTHTHTQLLAQEPKWGIHNSIVDYQNLSISPLPTSPNPDYTQNAIWDANGDLVIYEADGKIYNKNGGVILDMNTEVNSLYNVPSAQTGFTEFIFVPVPGFGNCDKYYGILGYSDGGSLINPYPTTYITDVVWCEIDLSNGLGVANILPQSGLRVARQDINCNNRSTESYVTVDYAIHLEITNVQNNGNRYLFAANGNCVSVLEVKASGIDYIDGYSSSSQFLPNLRSEMEIFKNGETYEIAMSYYGPLMNQNFTANYLTIFEFDMSNGMPVMSHYHVPIPGPENTNKVVKGLEFSDNGLVLYASIMTLNNQLNSVISGDNIIYVGRSNLSQPFTNTLPYGGTIVSGAATQDFGIGMIEKGADGKMWFIGSGKLANLINPNNPLPSNFTSNSMSIANQVSTAYGYNDALGNGSPSPLDNAKRGIYLLVDQIDGENYSNWLTGSNLYPSVIETCLFPYTFPYNIPANGLFTYTGQSTMYNGMLILLTSGTLTISYENKYGCEYVESVSILLKEEIWCEAEFTRHITETVNPDVLVTASCDHPLTTNHEYYLYESDGQGGWVLLDSCFTANCTLTGLYNNQSFKIEHIVHNLVSTCHSIEASTQYFTIN